jgi:hypothetical protein
MYLNREPVKRVQKNLLLISSLLPIQDLVKITFNFLQNRTENQDFTV